jgi:subtilisin-like proprotein convertase family protein
MRLALVGLGVIAISAAGASSAAAKTAKAKTITSTLNTCVSTAIGIPDHLTTANAPGVAVAIPVAIPNFRGKPQNGVVTAVNSVGIRITHTFAGDLTVLLVSPSGQVVTLVNRRGSNADGYGSGGASCAGSLVSFVSNDIAPGTSAIGVNPGGTETPISGTYRPESSLSPLIGGQARGNWVLFVIDGAAGDVGQLNAFALNLTYQYKKGSKKGK